MKSLLQMNVLEFLRSAQANCMCHSVRDQGLRLEVVFCLIILGVLQIHVKMDSGPEYRKLMSKMMLNVENRSQYNSAIEVEFERGW